MGLTEEEAECFQEAETEGEFNSCLRDIEEDRRPNLLWDVARVCFGKDTQNQRRACLSGAAQTLALMTSPDNFLVTPSESGNTIIMLDDIERQMRE